MEWPATIDFTNAQARARSVTTTINHVRMPRPTFTWASQNVDVVAALLDTLPMPSTNGLGKVYRQLRIIVGVATE
jgi:hypothetical protein